MTSVKSFSKLVLEINAAARVPSHWNYVLKRIAHEVDATKASMHRHEFAKLRHTGGARLHSFGYDQAAAKAYQSYFARYDPWVQRIRERFPGHSSGTSDALISEADLRKTEFYAKYARPNEIFYVSWITVEENERLGSGLAVIRPEDAKQFTAEHVHLLRSLAPHLEQAFDLQRLLEHLRETNALLQTSVDKAHVALIALAEDGRVVNMSKAAEALLESRDPLRVKEGHIQAIDSHDDHCLQKMFNAAAHPWANTAREKGESLRLKRKDGRTYLQAKVFAYPSTLDLTPSRDALYCEDRPSVLVLLFDPLAQSATQEATLRSHLRLSPQEMRVAMLLWRNYRQGDIAKTLGISDENVRQCLHKIYEKTGVEGQMGLMQIMCALAVEM